MSKQSTRIITQDEIRKMSRPQLLDYFQRLLSVKKSAPGTIKNYIYYITDFLDFASLEDITTITREHLIAYILFLSEPDDDDKGFHPYAASTINAAVSAVLKFLLLVFGIRIQRDELPIPTVKHKPRPCFTTEQVKTIIDDWDDPMYKCIVALAFDTGLRPRELVQIRYEDIHKEDKIIHVRPSKRQKERDVVYSQYTADLLNAWQLKKYPVSGSVPSEGFVFKALKPKKEHADEDRCMSSSALSHRFKTFITDKNYDFVLPDHTFYSLRHSFSTEMVRRDLMPFKLALRMGHASIQMTMNYIKHNPEFLREKGSPCDQWRI